MKKQVKAIPATTRNTEDFEYFYVGIPKNSQTVARLKKDMQETGIRYITQMIATRVADYYKLLDSMHVAGMSSTSSNSLPETPNDNVDDLLDAYADYQQ
jgi:RNA polymerase-interacting CarD/CdnL/TRCF family regulator